MNQSTLKSLCILGLIFPLIFFAWQIHDNINKDDTYQPWKIKIVGYDPRHILKGRFIRYRYEFDWADGSDEQTCEDFKDDCCLCLMGSYDAPKAELLTCSSITGASCKGI